MFPSLRLNEPKHKIFEAGYEESEVDLRVEFELQSDGKWYVVDCYTGWYGYDLPIGELKQTIQNVKEENAAFKEIHPQKGEISIKYQVLSISQSFDVNT